MKPGEKKKQFPLERPDPSDPKQKRTGNNRGHTLSPINECDSLVTRVYFLLQFISSSPPLMPKSGRKKKEKAADFAVGAKFGARHLFRLISALRRKRNSSSARENKSRVMPLTLRSSLDVCILHTCRQAKFLHPLTVAIALPRQTVSIQKDESEPTTRRNLSLSDLVGQLKHYSPSIRKGKSLCQFFEFFPI